jgi:hypothetical protein
MRRALLLLAVPALVAGPARGQEALRETLTQAKALWTGAGDREGAAAKFEMVVAALEPRARALEGEPLLMLCEAYTWLAVLDDRVPEKRPQAAKRLEAMLDLAPDQDIDRNLATSRLVAVFDALRAAKLGIVQCAFQPEGGVLRVDGRAAAPTATRRLTPGSHLLSYAKPGYDPQEITATVTAGGTATAAFSLVRSSTTLTVHTHPSGAEILLDGRSLGRSSGQAGPEMAPHAEPLALKAEDLSAPFTVGEVKAGRHILEVRAACFKPVRFEIDEKYTAPFADHTLAPVKLQPSKGLVTVASAAAGGELLLNGQSHGPLPVDKLSVCSGAYDLVVKYPSGGYTERIQVPEDGAVMVAARPKPRLALLGIEGGEEFAGRARLLQALAALPARLAQVACLPPRENETPAEALIRLQASRETELVLTARPQRSAGGTRIELALATLDGEEQRFPVRALDEDPLADLAQRLGRAVPVLEPGIGVALLDVAGFEPGPYVLGGDPAVMKEGIRPFRPLSSVNGRSVADVAGLRTLVREQAGRKLQVLQMGVPSEIPVEPQALELPLNDPGLAYPFLLADLRLRALGAKGDELAALQLNQAVALMHFGRFDKAAETLKGVAFAAPGGVGTGTALYYRGLCLRQLGSVYTPEAIQSFTEALKHPLATLFGPDGPLVAPLARLALDDLKP